MSGGGEKGGGWGGDNEPAESAAAWRKDGTGAGTTQDKAGPIQTLLWTRLGGAVTLGKDLSGLE